MTILDTLPPLPPKGYGNDGHSDEAMRERDRQVAEHVIRACAMQAHMIAVDQRIHGLATKGALMVKKAILALLEQKT